MTLNDILLYFTSEDTESKTLYLAKCTNCHKIILSLDDRQIYPLGSQRPQVPDDVPPTIAADYTEACLIEPLSKKGAAALARRCLQNLLHDQKINARDLSQEIDQAMETLPHYLANAIDSIRVIGNFAAHPLKSTSTGEIVEVETGEAELTIDVLEQLFDFYYVKPAEAAKKIAAINIKLNSAGKPSLKTR